MNLAIKAQSPKEYMQKIKEQINNKSLQIGEIDSWADLQENLQMNCIPETIFELKADDYMDFLDERRKLIVEKIRRYYNKL